MAKYYHGQWKVVCDVCGWRFPSSQVRKRWDGQVVCEADYETDHPQKHIRAQADPKPVPSDMIRRWHDDFTAVCTLITVQSIPGIGIPGCLVPSKVNTLPYTNTNQAST